MYINLASCAAVLLIKSTETACISTLQKRTAERMDSIGNGARCTCTYFKYTVVEHTCAASVQVGIANYFSHDDLAG